MFQIVPAHLVGMDPKDHLGLGVLPAHFSPGDRMFLLRRLPLALFALFGALAVSVAGPLMPWTLAFAAGAMLFVISDEIIPETHSRGFENLATFSLLVGFAVMMYLDATLG